ncbi:Uncharacterised protein [Mycobacteroides abscessus subsp. abscessus]|nr:Uncharacterised protein [Mycobacteroides abscessus subsp. abscessus]
MSEPGDCAASRIRVIACLRTSSEFCVHISSNWSITSSAGRSVCSCAASSSIAASRAANASSPGVITVHRQPASGPSWTTCASRPARTSDDFPTPDIPTTITPRAISLASRSALRVATMRSTSLATRTSRPKK